MAQDQVKPAGEHIGTVLKQAREERGLDIGMLAEELMIRRLYLEALEEGAFRDLPERVYAVGFVRSYAAYVGLDPNAVSEQFKRDAYGAQHGSSYQVELTMPEPMLQSVMPNRAAIFTAFIVLAAIVGGIVYATQGKNADVSPTAIPAPIEETSEADTDAPDIDASTPDADAPGDRDFMPPSATSETDGGAAVEFSAPETSSSAATAPTNAATAASDANVEAALPEPTAQANLADAPAAPRQNVENRLVIEALKTAWVEVKDSKGTILFTSILKAGQLLPLPNDMMLTVTTGNAGGLRLIKDGAPDAAPMGQTNEVKRNIVLDPKVIFGR